MHRVAIVASVLLLPVLVQLPVLSPWISADPILWWSGLAWRFPGDGQFVIGSPGWADGNAGVTTEALGHLAAEDWLHGTVPWWNPYSGVGMPLAGEMQNSALFLPFVLLLHFGRGVLLLKIAVQIVTGLAMFGLLRALAIRFSVACVCAVLAEFNGTFAWYAHGPIMPVAFLPVLLFGIERCRIELERPPLRWPALPITIIAGAVAYSIYAGFPETAFLDGLFGAVFAAGRISTLPGPVRPMFCLAVLAGAACGVLLAAPAAVPFLDILRHSYLSVHADLSSSGLLPGSGGMLFLPYLFGPILANFFTTGTGQNLWWHAGGYIQLPLMLLAVAGLISVRGRERSIRVAVGLWCIVSFARAARLPVAVTAFDAVPFLRHVLFPNYVEPTWEIAAIILAAFALEDWRNASRARPILGACAWISVAVLATVAIALGWPEVARLSGRMPHYALIAGLPSLLSAEAFGVAAIVLSRAATRPRFVLLGGLICLEAIGNFAAPLLSATAVGTRPLDLGPVEFLRSHLGLQRFDSVGVFKPNYGAFEKLASVNHNYLPVPNDWVDYLHAHLSATMDGVEYSGEELLPAGGNNEAFKQADRPSVSAKQAVDVLERLGVAYVLAEHGTDPLTETEGTRVEWRDPRPRALLPGQSMSFSFVPSGRVAGSDILEAGVVVGTYRGQSDGVLTVTVCSFSRCQHGSRDARQAGDNALLDIPLPGASPVTSGPLDVKISYAGGSSGIAIYEWPSMDGTGRLPLFTLRYRTPALRLPVVYADPLVDIYELPAPAPYYAAQGGRCRLQVLGRLAVSADCAGPDRLIRRELWFPGWEARVCGHAAPVARSGALFQSVALPAGASIVRFSYAPPFLRLCLAAWLGGIALLGAGFAWRRHRRA